MSNVLVAMAPKFLVLEATRGVDISQESRLEHNPKALWRNARRQADYSIPDAGIHRLEHVQSDDYFRCAWIVLNRVFSEGSHLRLDPNPIHRLDDANAAATFFEFSPPETFTTFCAIVHSRLNPALAKRVEIFRSSFAGVSKLGWQPKLLLEQRVRPTAVYKSLIAASVASAKPIGEEEGETKHPEFSALLDKARELIATGEVDRGLDVIYTAVDDILWSGDYSNLNSTFGTINVAASPLDFLLGILTASLPVRTRLSLRSRFFETVKDVLVERDEYEEGLLDGLA